MEQYFNDAITYGFAVQNQFYTSLANLTRSTIQVNAAKEVAKDIRRLRIPTYLADLINIEAQFMAAIKEVKKVIGHDFTVQQTLTKEAAERMFTELTKNQDMKTSRSRRSK